MKGYLANSLFSSADQMFNRYLAEKIREALPDLDLYVPQENEAINDKSQYADSIMIFDGDNHYLDEADLLIAVIDGVEIDAGVAMELGRFITKKELWEKPRYVYGLYTDVRQHGADNDKKINALINDPAENQFMYRNLYVIGGIKKHGKLCRSVEELIHVLKKDHGNEK
mgnify:CR=1 FL=1